MSSTALKTLLDYSNFTIEQQDAIARLYEFDNTLLIASKGFGKAAIAQTAAQELLNEGVLSRVVVIAPPKVGRITWGTEYAKWAHLEEVGLALGDIKQRRGVLAGPHRIVVISADSVAWFMKEMASGDYAAFDGLIVDEISRLKSVGGKAVKALRPRLNKFKWRIGLSATPVAESGIDIYAQALVVDNGAALGRNKEKFMRTYFMTTDYMGYDWEIQPGGAERLASALRDMVWVAPSTDYEASLPLLKERIILVDMPASAWSAYEELANTLVLESADVEVPNAAVLAGKLQQITSGFLYREDDTTLRLHGRKFTELDRLWNGRLNREPALVMYNFVYELAELKRLYPGAKVLAEDPARNVAAWNAGELEMLLIHARSAGHGLNLQDGGALLIQLGPCWSADLHDQVVGRLWRRGQTKTVRRYILACEDSIDEVILDRLASKQENEGALMKHLRNVTRKN